MSRMTSEEYLRRAAEIGARIKEARVRAGYTNATLFGAEIGIDRNNIYRWERGGGLPDVLALDAIARVTRTPADWILRGEVTPEWADTIERWRQTANGVSDKALAFIRSVPLHNYRPSPGALDLLLTAFRYGLSPEQALAAASVNETADELNKRDPER
jgi:transcriptional regulator with XRE-family HTH domain